jgi:hypothetical protein
MIYPYLLAPTAMCLPQAGRTDDPAKAKLVVVPVFVDRVSRGLCTGGRGAIDTIMRQMVEEIRRVGLIQTHRHLLIANDFKSRNSVRKWREIDGKVLVWANMENLAFEHETKDGKGDSCAFGIGYNTLYSLNRFGNMRLGGGAFGKQDLALSPTKFVPSHARRYVSSAHTIGEPGAQLSAEVLLINTVAAQVYRMMCGLAAPWRKTNLAAWVLRCMRGCYRVKGERWN